MYYFSASYIIGAAPCLIILLFLFGCGQARGEESVSWDNMYRRAKQVIPKLERTQHKGQSGRIGIVGGSAEYTGAPYYAAIAALRCGADLSFVFCGEPAAAGPIKTYSPELIVYPSLSYLNGTLTRLTALVLGPGLGRDGAVLKSTSEAIRAARDANVPLVLDGDALWLLKDQPDLIRGYKRAIITPNAMEFDRLHRAAFNDQPAPPIKLSEESYLNTSSSPVGLELSVQEEPGLSVAKIADWLGGVTVLRKGVVDIISDGTTAFGCSAFGSARRCGGQGDVLAGSCGVFLSWATSGKSPMNDIIGAAYGASLLTRRANQQAFELHKRSMTTPDLLHTLGVAFHDLYDSDSSPWCAL